MFKKYKVYTSYDGEAFYRAYHSIYDVNPVSFYTLKNAKLFALEQIRDNRVTDVEIRLGTCSCGRDYYVVERYTICRKKN